MNRRFIVGAAIGLAVAAGVLSQATEPVSATPVAAAWVTANASLPRAAADEPRAGDTGRAGGDNGAGGIAAGPQNLPADVLD